MPNIRRSNAEWEELIKDCKSCGLSDREWMKQHHISSSSFYKKLHELYGEISNVPVARKRLPEIAETHEIVELNIGEESKSLQKIAPITESINTVRSEAAVTVRMGSYSIEIGNQAEAETIRNTMLALSSIC